jgi:hypothetical protein
MIDARHPLRQFDSDVRGWTDLPIKVLDEAATRSNAAPASHGVICMVTSSILAA